MRCPHGSLPAERPREKLGGPTATAPCFSRASPPALRHSPAWLIQTLAGVLVSFEGLFGARSTGASRWLACLNPAPLRFLQPVLSRLNYRPVFGLCSSFLLFLCVCVCCVVVGLPHAAGSDQPLRGELSGRVRAPPEGAGEGAAGVDVRAVQELEAVHQGRREHPAAGVTDAQRLSSPKSACLCYRPWCFFFCCCSVWPRCVLLRRVFFC